MFEILIVVLIIATIAAIALPSFTKSKESSLDKEANLTLSLIQDAEQFYHIEHDKYLACTNISEINNNLKLYIPTPGNWNYTVVSTDDHNFTAKAHRLGSDSRTYCINQSADNSTLCAW